MAGMIDLIVQELSRVEDRQTLRELEFAIKDRRQQLLKKEKEEREAKVENGHQLAIDIRWGAWIRSLEPKGKSADGQKDYYYDPRDNRWFGVKTYPYFSICQVYACATCGKGALDKDYPGYCSKDCQDKMLDLMAEDMIGGEANE